MVNEGENLFRPYAPPANMQALMKVLRRTNVPPRITRDVVKTAGISETIAPRVVATLRFLDLITDKNEPTETLSRLVSSADDEYRQLLAKTIRRAYADDFESIDPGKDPQERIMDAFQRYTPRSQHGRQVMLFLGLCREANIPTFDMPRRRSMRGNSQSLKTPRKGLLQRPFQNTDGTGPQGPPRPGGQRAPQYTLAEFLGITLEDAAYMPEEDFRHAWSAMGTVYRWRAQRTYLTPQSDTAMQTEDEDLS